MPLTIEHTGAAGRDAEGIMHGVKELSALHTKPGAGSPPVGGGQAATEENAHENCDKAFKKGFGEQEVAVPGCVKNACKIKDPQ
jgi:hypothetical protein